MLNGSLVSYSDSENSEKDEGDVWIQSSDRVRVVVRQTGAELCSGKQSSNSFGRKPERKLYIPPGGRPSFRSLPAMTLSELTYSDDVFQDDSRNVIDKCRGKEKNSSSNGCSKVTRQRNRTKSLPGNVRGSLLLPVKASVSSIPLPEETSKLSSKKIKANSGGDKKQKHATQSIYVPPPQREFMSSPPLKGYSGDSGGISGDGSKAVTPKSSKFVEESGGSGVKRKGDYLGSPKHRKRERSIELDRDSPQDQSTTAALLHTQVNCSRAQRDYRYQFLKSTDSNPASLTSELPSSGEMFESLRSPKRVTLKPFWLFCPPPRRQMSSCVEPREAQESVRRASTSPQPLSLPYDTNTTLLMQPPVSPVPNIQQSFHSLPDLSAMQKTPEFYPANQMCSVSGYITGMSSTEVSPATSMSSLNLDIPQNVSEIPGLTRRHSQGSGDPVPSRSRINSLPSTLRRRVFEGSNTSSQAVSPPTSPSIWKFNFQKRYFGFKSEFIDSHCHLDFLYRRGGFKGTFQKYKDLNHETFPPNFAGCVAVFCEPHSFTPKGGLWMDLSEESDVWVAMGCHPKCAEDYTSWIEDALTTCLSNPKVIAAGEFGLDYSGRFMETADRQKDVFVRQLKIALALDKPLVIHCRKAENDTFEIMEKFVPKNVRIHRHCFTENFEEAKRWLDTFPNLYVGLTPLVTYRTAAETHDVARKVPLDRLLLETDAPYFVPHSVPRSEMSLSHPGMAITVAEKVAYFKDIPVKEVLEATRHNTLKMYGI